MMVTAIFGIPTLAPELFSLVCAFHDTDKVWYPLLCKPSMANDERFGPTWQM